MIFLYHATTSQETYESILKNGLYSRKALGNPVPFDLQSAEKSSDIFFHPLRKNEELTALPISRKTYFVAIAIPSGTNLQVNNRLYSFNQGSLHTYNIDEYFKMDKYDQEGLPECRIKIDHIPPKYIMSFGTIEQHSMKETIIPFRLEEKNLRFGSSSYRKIKQNEKVNNCLLSSTQAFLSTTAFNPGLIKDDKRFKAIDKEDILYRPESFSFIKNYYPS
jgi:hypothetical protein